MPRTRGSEQRRYWLVGDSPSRDAADNPEGWLTPDGTGLPNPANRLLELTGWSLAVFLETFQPRTNLWAHPNLVCVAEGRRQAAKIADRSLADGSNGVIILGVRAAQMFDLHADEPLEWHGRFAFMPHPAWQSRSWTPELRERARAFFESLVRSSSEKAGGRQGR